nr:hypothetical protein DGKKSRWO_DGKKSRWO_CDS_0067 [uncultured phage]CAI9752231.1 hypothetical protein CVNMHQAP_CVNMHQAP_CDS_0067 [uncultured phage]
MLSFVYTSFITSPYFLLHPLYHYTILDPKY